VLQGGHSAAKMSAEQEGLKSWQIFSGLFVGFWITSAYFDHFLMTAVFCIVFGVVGEIITKEMYGDTSDKKKKKEKEFEEIHDKSVSEKMANNEAIWQKAEASMEAADDDDETPPPLPDRDYETGRLDTLSAKLQALVDASELEDGNRTPENNDEAFSPSVRREYTRTVSDEYNQNTSTLNSNLTQDISSSHSIIEEEIDEQRNFTDRDDSSGPKFYAPDSSDDEEDDDDDFASREVHFDDSESEEEDFDQYQKNASQENISKSTGETILKSDDDIAKEDENPMKAIVNGHIGGSEICESNTLAGNQKEE